MNPQQVSTMWQELTKAMPGAAASLNPEQLADTWMSAFKQFQNMDLGQFGAAAGAGTGAPPIAMPPMSIPSMFMLPRSMWE